MIRKSAVLCLLFVVYAAAFGGQRDRFVFTQLKYDIDSADNRSSFRDDSKWDPYPEVWQDINEFMAVTTSVKTITQRRIAGLSDDLLFSSPFLAILGAGRFPALSGKDIETLRRYVYNGGIIFADDSSGMRSSEFDSGFRRAMALAFPDIKLKKLPPDHPIFRSYYLLRQVSGRRMLNNYIEGIDISGRTAVIYSQNDMFGAWAKDRFGNYLRECNPGGEQQRFDSQKFIQNLIMYSVTGTYKSDSIHKPFLEQKLR